jgi:hypothetical protein
VFAPVLTYLRTHKMPDIVFRELTGNNIPHVAIVRNQDELINQSISQFGNTAAYFGTGLVMDKGIESALRLLKVQISPVTKQWFHLGKSLSIFSMIAAINLAMPFLRNYVTTLRTGTDNYAEMIGEQQREAVSKEELANTLKKYQTRFLKTVAMGALASTGLMALTAAITAAKIPMPKVATFLQKHIGLEGGKFENFKALSAVLFWVVPTFSGLLAGARDKYEVKELALRFGAFNLAFFVFPYTVEKMIDHLVQKMPPSRLFGASKNLAYLGKFFSSLVFCSAVPTVLNIHLTRQRVKQDAAREAGAVLPKIANKAPISQIPQRSLPTQWNSPFKPVAPTYPPMHTFMPVSYRLSSLQTNSPFINAFNQQGYRTA